MKLSHFSSPVPRPSRHDLEAFFYRVTVADSGCWIWTGSRNWKGYSVFRGNSGHRFTHAWFIGAIPNGYEVDHLCRVRECVNPAHLEAVTVTENHRRASFSWSHGRCRNGHQMTAENIYTWRNRGVLMRTCLKCRMASRHRWIQRRTRANQAIPLHLRKAS